MRKTLVAGALTLAATMAPAVAQAKDINHDHIPDRWERAYHLSLKVDQSGRDQDHDGLKNRAEFKDHTSPRNSDSDSDGLPDGHDPQPAPPAQGTADTTPEPPHTDTPPPAPEPTSGHVVSYQQSSGFGGVLTLERSNGEKVTAYFGEKTDLECGDATCTKDHLVAGAPVVTAEHAKNDRGYDVWTKVVLAAADGSVTPPPANTPPPTSTPPPAHPLGGTIASYEQSPYFGGTLTITRPNGESVAAWYGDGSDLRCAPSTAVEFQPCTKAALVPGTLAADAQHAVNGGGHDVWTHILLIVPGFSG
jgi:hypothetical protein